jgi:hypothetical protein
MAFNIPSVETGAKENKNTVVASIITIQGMIAINSIALKMTPEIFGKGVLDNLPGSVRSFTYSPKYPDITATREGDGIEDWDVEKAINWGLSDQPERVREGVLARLGEIK